MLKITLYSADKCPHCKSAKAFLKQRKLAFVELNVDRNRRAAKELQRLGARGLPFIVIGQQSLSGFDVKKLERMIASQQR
ncbi:glutaredoxin [Sinobacterium caligoides]|uniref:Glutaredoxin n=1 Tax=Sinobacterium caligoides TaxID=933926 RepID=A0A3N2DDU7_9GAMM|nr:glutaredoxin family protein [Sinobacterium caligoides]ROR97959.1 glutaredoxin [Sinobacterium caligoides]